MNAIEKEMKNMLCAFEFNDGDKVPIGRTKIGVKMIFDINMMNLTRNVRLVTGVQHIDPPKESVYSSIVSRESIRLDFLVSVLDGLDILAADIQNAYLNVPTKEKV